QSRSARDDKVLGRGQCRPEVLLHPIRGRGRPRHTESYAAGAWWRSFSTSLPRAYFSASMPSPVTAEMGNSFNLFLRQKAARRSSLFCGLAIFFAAAERPRVDTLRRVAGSFEVAIGVGFSRASILDATM